jgi:hypothetical protein
MGDRGEWVTWLEELTKCQERRLSCCDERWGQLVDWCGKQRRKAGIADKPANGELAIVSVGPGTELWWHNDRHDFPALSWR